MPDFPIFTHVPAPSAPILSMVPATGDRAGIESQQRLTESVRAVHDAAFDPVALEALAILILEDAGGLPAALDREAVRIAVAELLRPPPDAPRELPYPAERYGHIPDEVARAIAGDGLARLLKARHGKVPAVSAPVPSGDVLAVWGQHVAYLQGTGEARTSPTPSPALLRFIESRLRQTPGLDKDAFFLPFRQLAERCMRVIDSRTCLEPLACLLGEALEGGVISYRDFAMWAGACARDVPATTPATPGPYPGNWKQRTAHLYWDITLLALFSPMSLSLLQNNRACLSTLTDWVGVDARLRACGNPPPRLPTRTACMLASTPVNRAATCIGALEYPEIIPLLAEAGVPVQHAMMLLAQAGGVDGRFLQAEAKRVADSYRTAPATSANEAGEVAIPADYTQDYLSPMLDEYSARAARRRASAARLEPYWKLEQLRNHIRLNKWTVSTAAQADGQARLLWTFRPARALFAAWEAEGIPVEKQLWLARVMTQGFDEAWARDLVLSGNVAQDRLTAWFMRALGSDLSAFMGDALKTAVMRWLRDPDIDEDLLSLAPSLIQSGMDIDRAEQVLRAESAAILPALPVIFDPLVDMPARVRHGLVSLEQLEATMRDRSALTFASALKAAPLYVEDISPLRHALFRTHERLLGAAALADAARAALAEGGPADLACGRLIRTWRDAAGSLAAMLRPALEDDIGRDPAGMTDELSRLRLELAAALPGPATDVPMEGDRLWG